MQMKLTTSLILSSMLLGLASGACIDTTKPPPTDSYKGGPFDASLAIGDITSAQALVFAPNSKQCTAPGGECSTPDVIAKGLNDAFAFYGLTTLGQKAAMIAYMTFESADFSYNINHYPAPGRPGQGTKSMMQFPHLYNFAAAFPEHQDIVKKNSPQGNIAVVTFDNMDSLFTAEQKNAIRATVLPDAYTFMSAPWFLTSYPATKSECNKDTLNNGYAGFLATMETSCYWVGILTLERKASWCKTVMGISPVGMGAPAECN